MVEKLKLVLFDRSNKTGAIDMEMDGSVLEENHLLRCWGLLSLLNWIRALELSLQENQSFDLFYEDPFSQGCSVTL